MVVAEQIKAADTAEKQIALARSKQYALGKDVLGEFMMTFRGMAALHQPSPPGQPRRQYEDETKFLNYAKLAIECAGELANYQSPKYRSIQVAAAPPDQAPLQPPSPGDDAKVVSMVERDPARAADTYRRMIALPLGKTGS